MRTAVVLLVTVFVVFSGFFLFYRGTSAPSTGKKSNEITPVRLEGDRIVQGPVLNTDVSGFPDKGLVDQEGNPVRMEDFKGRPVLLSFIYTSCPDQKMCPLITRKMVQIQEKVLEEDQASAQFVSVTFDPETDSPDTLKHYGQQKKVDFRNWSFLTGPAGTIEQLTDRFNIETKSKNDSGDVMLHNMRTYLLDRNLTVKYAWKGSKWSVNDVFQKLKTLQ